ncbi:MAG: prepilin peptidase [Actinomycetota bacterium]|nr:prepilin peptidase [Actinomycetota bacterium]
MAAALLGSSLGALLAVVTISDLRTRLIPDRALALGAASALALAAIADPTSLPERLGSAAGAGGFLFAAALARPGGIGLGDVKLAAVLGLYLGGGVLLALIVALGAGSLAGVLLIAAGGWSARDRTIPFAPFLATGAAVAWAAAVNVDPWS